MIWSKVFDFLREHIYPISALVALVVLFLLLLGAYGTMQSKKSKKAEEAFYYALHQDLKTTKRMERIPVLEKIRRDYPSTRSAFKVALLMADTYREEEKEKEALSLYEKAAKEAPSALDMALAYYAAAISQEKMGDCLSAITSYEKVHQDKAFTFFQGEVLLGKARCYESLQQYEKARSIYQSLEHTYTQNSYYRNMAIALKRKLKKEKG